MKATITKDFSNLRRLVPIIRDRYSKDLRFPLKIAILKDISRGISPVKGKGKFKKYSKSYKDAIRGLVQFFTIQTGGVKKVIAITTTASAPAPSLPFVLGKKISPVNLKLSGQMLKSMKVRRIGSSKKRLIEIEFEDGVAAFHNKLGAGKAKTIRRLLPTESGEKFNRKISKLTITILQRTVRRILTQFNMQ